MREDQTGTREGEPIFDSLIWQPRLALQSRFSCPDDRKDRILEASDWLLFSLQKRIYSRWQFSNKSFRFPGESIIQQFNIFLAAREWNDHQANERLELNHKKAGLKPNICVIAL